MEKLKFFDLRTRKKFMSNDYKLSKKKGRHFAIAKAPSGILSYRIVSESFYKKNK